MRAPPTTRAVSLPGVIRIATHPFRPTYTVVIVSSHATAPVPAASIGLPATPSGHDSAQTFAFAGSTSRVRTRTSPLLKNPNRATSTDAVAGISVRNVSRTVVTNPSHGVAKRAKNTAAREKNDARVVAAPTETKSPILLPTLSRERRRRRDDEHRPAVPSRSIVHASRRTNESQ